VLRQIAKVCRLSLCMLVYLNVLNVMQGEYSARSDVVKRGRKYIVAE
jgi:hypothetical protein